MANPDSRTGARESGPSRSVIRSARAACFRAHVASSRSTASPSSRLAVDQSATPKRGGPDRPMRQSAWNGRGGIYNNPFPGQVAAPLRLKDYLPVSGAKSVLQKSNDFRTCGGLQSHSPLRRDTGAYRSLRRSHAPGQEATSTVPQKPASRAACR